MSEWKEYELGELVESISNTYKFDNNDVIFLNTSDILGGKVINHNAYNPSTLPGQAKKTIQKGDILYSEIRPANNRNAYIDFDAERYVVSTKLMVLRPKDKSLTKYIFLYLTSKETLRYLQFLAEGRSGTFPQITFSEVSELVINVPPPKILHYISCTISSLDSKIDLLLRQNQTLENIAQTLFKRWFFDFEFPDKDGNPYKSSGGKMVEGELGEIPEGWKVGKLEDITEILNGFAFKSNEYKDHGAQVIRTTNFCSLGYLELNDLVYLEPEAFGIYEKYQLQLFDFLLVMVGASIGKSVIVSSHALPSLQNQNMWNFRSKIKNGQFYLIYTMRRTVKANIGSASGSARDFFRKDYFYSLSCVIPSQSILGLFNDNIQTVYKKIDNNISEIQTLTKIRDTLLPKLMSGQIRVKGL